MLHIYEPNVSSYYLEQDVMEGRLINNAAQLMGIPVRHGPPTKGTGRVILLYGPAGSGKTPIAATLVKSKKYGHPMGYIDCEAGSSSISHYDDIDFFDVKTWKQLNAIRTMIERGNHGYKSFVFDNLSEIREINMKTEVQKNPQETPQIQDYGKNTSDMKLFVRWCRDIAQAQGITIILIAWDEVEKDEWTNVLKRILSLTPKLGNEVPGILDIIGYIEVERDGTRIIDFTNSKRLISKFRRTTEKEALQIPLRIPVLEPDCDVMADIVECLNGDKEWPAKKYSKMSKAETKEE